MKKRVLLFGFTLIASISFSQNLISNPGFENYIGLPNTYGQFSLATGWENCLGAGTPDYFNTSGTVGTYFGTNIPHTGDGMCGFCPYHGTIQGFREYLSMPLSSPLIVGQTYTVSFWLASGIDGNYGYGCNNVGVAFSNGTLLQTGTDPILIAPQIEITTVFYDTTWTQFSFQYTATSAYDYFAIGNFRDDASTTIQLFGVNYNAVYYFVDDIEVSVFNQAPVALFNAPHHICPGTCTDFINLSQYATSYLWSFPGGNPSTSTDVNPTMICYNTPGTYDVSLIATNAVTSDTLMLTNYITVYPYPPPQGILQSGDTLFANQGAVTYQWYLNGTLINGATNYFYLALQSGDYNVVCTDANGCEVEAVIFNVVASVKNEMLGIYLDVYPNPASTTLSIRSSQSIQGVQVFNALGEKISSAITIKGNDLDVSSLSPGSYWLEINYGKEILRKQFVKN